MSVGAIGAEILGGGGIQPPPWYTSLKHPMTSGVKQDVQFYQHSFFVFLIKSLLIMKWMTMLHKTDNEMTMNR